MDKEKNTPKLKVKKVKGRIKVLKVMPYRGMPVYIRQVDQEVFLYDLIFNNQIYSDYIIIFPDKGKKRLNDKQVQGAAGILFIAASTTIDELIKKWQGEMMSGPIPKPANKRTTN